MPSRLPLGKLSPEMLSRLLHEHTYALPGDRLVVRPGVGEDAAVIDMGERWLVAKTDPITFATDEIGWYAVNVNANDIAAAGATPRWFLSTLLLPGEQTDEALIDRIMGQIADACRGLGVVPCGGHTEVTYGLDRPIVVGVMLGEAAAGQVVRTSGVEVGDAILLTKGVAVEGTSIMARERGNALRQQFPGDLIDRCQGFLHDPGISVVREAQAATSVASVHAMHDPTEGGVATGLWELSTAAGVGLEVDAESLPIYAETQALCDALGLDPLGVIASGSMLIAVSQQDVDPVCAAIRRAGIAVACIGRAVEPETSVTIRRGDDVELLPRYDQDEITKLF